MLVPGASGRLASGTSIGTPLRPTPVHPGRLLPARGGTPYGRRASPGGLRVHGSGGGRRVEWWMLLGPGSSCSRRHRSAGGACASTAPSWVSTGT